MGVGGLVYKLIDLYQMLVCMCPAFLNQPGDAPQPPG